MSAPISLDIPHKLGKAAVRERLDGGVGKIGRLIPGGATVEHRWDGDTMRCAARSSRSTSGCSRWPARRASSPIHAGGY